MSLQSSAAGYARNLVRFSKVIALLWLIEILDRFIIPSGLEWYGIHPRDWSHWEGIFLAPFLHGSWGHLIGNSLSLLFLGGAVLVHGWRKLIEVSVASALIAGALVFFIGSAGSVHVGASSVIFGYLGFLLGMGIYERSLRSIVLAVLVLIFYGGGLSTMFPNRTTVAARISWEGHLGGALGGFFMARSKRKGRRKKS